MDSSWVQIRTSAVFKMNKMPYYAPRDRLIFRTVKNISERFDFLNICRCFISMSIEDVHVSVNVEDI
jgi:hypothetical protein